MPLEPKYLSKPNLEAKAEKLLGKYCNGRLLSQAQAIDIYHFAEFEIGATIDFQPLSEDGLTLGMSVFQEGSVPVYSHPGAMIEIEFSANTIIIDNEALEASPESRERFTVAHECSHQILHPRYFYRDPRMKSRDISYRPYREKSRCDTDKFDRAEWQADYLGAALLMPRPTFIAEFHRCAVTNWHSLSDNSKRAVVSALSETFEVSRQATALRIKNLELVN